MIHRVHRFLKRRLFFGLPLDVFSWIMVKWVSRVLDQEIELIKCAKEVEDYAAASINSSLRRTFYFRHSSLCRSSVPYKKERDFTSKSTGKTERNLSMKVRFLLFTFSLKALLLAGFVSVVARSVVSPSIVRCSNNLDHSFLTSLLLVLLQFYEKSHIPPSSGGLPTFHSFLHLDCGNRVIWYLPLKRVERTSLLPQITFEEIQIPIEWHLFLQIDLCSVHSGCSDWIDAESKNISWIWSVLSSHSTRANSFVSSTFLWIHWRIPLLQWMIHQKKIETRFTTRCQK